MKSNALLRRRDFWIAIAALLLAGAIAVITYNRLDAPDAQLGPLQVYHWASVIGAFIMACFLPLYAYMKRKHPSTRKGMFDAHLYVNLIAFQFISLHFGVIGQIKPYVDTGTGFMQYAVVTMLVLTGIIRRFQILPKLSNTWRFLHMSLMVTFYTVLINHILGAIRLLNF